ncbi:MAG: lysylphosphatidylglycerol synthase transmembrane domain-containing protein [Candidatus Omnitrophota bacterium]
MKKGILLTFVRVFVSLALIILLLYIMRDKYADIAARLRRTDLSLFALAIGIFLVAVVTGAFRLKLIIEAQDLRVTFGETLSLAFIGYFFNNFLPTTIGGDVVKGYYLSKKTNEKMGSYSAIFVDRVIGLFTMIFMAFFALLFAGSQFSDNRVRYLIYLTTAISVTGIIFITSKSFARLFSFLLVFMKPFEDKIRRAYEVIHRYKHRRLLMYQSFFISIISQIFFFLSLGMLALSIGSKIRIMDLLLRMPVISALSLLPSINGLGVRESSTVVFFGPLIGKENAFAVSILWLLVLFIVSVAGGIVYATHPQFKIKWKEVEAAE